MERRVQRLYEASIEGSLTSLDELLQEDAIILDRCTTKSNAETPLHIAAMLGHFDFCSELLSRKPGLCEELDSRRSSALHLASAKGHVEIVKSLILCRPEMCLVVDGDGNNPIHLAAMKGRVDVLKELVRVDPSATHARVRTCEGGTILHLCVHYYQFEALKLLIELLNNNELVNAKDDDGNSILHLAVTHKQVETIQYLVSNTQIDVSAENFQGLTPIDILNESKTYSKYLQIIAHSLQTTSTQRSEGASWSEQVRTKKPYDQTLWLEKQRNSIMVVASLIATMAFQAGISPRGGFWQEDSNTHRAGYPIWKHKDPESYNTFLIFNTIGFLSSLSIILILISGLPLLTHKMFMWILTVIMWVSISATILTYGISMYYEYSIFFEAWVNLMFFLILVHTIRFVSYRTRCWTVKSRVLFWIFMVVGFSCVQALFLRNPIMAIPFALITLVAFLILQYAFQLLLLLGTKITSCYQGLKLHLISTNQTNVV